jgi:hypothetical protein
VKKLLAIGITMAVVFGLAFGASAFDTQRRLAAAGEVESMTFSLGGLPAKDECMIDMFDYAACGGYAWWVTWPVAFDSCFIIKNFVDPYEGITDCIPPYYPFNVEKIWFVLGPADAPDTNWYDITFDIDIEEAVWDEGLGCYGPGPELWRSAPVTFTLQGTHMYGLSVSFPSFFVDGPFFISIHIIDIPEGSTGWWNWYMDLDFYNPPYGDDCTPCWTWYELTSYGYPGWYEACGLGDPGDMWFSCYGRPAHNVAVDMGSFEAVAGDGMVTLNWQSLAEINNSHWFVNRDGVEIAQLEGQGNKETPTDYTYVDRDLTNGVTYSYMIEAVNYQGKVDPYGPVTATPLAANAVPGEFALSQNYPNPFNASTVIRYQLASDEHVTLKVYNINGQEVASLVDTDQKAGVYSVHWTGEGVSSGVYFYTMTAGDFSQTMKMVFVK